jgi:hypothetical protein
MENPVYYVQYAHARISSILRAADERGFDAGEVDDADLSLLDHPAELELLTAMAQLPLVVAEAAELRATQRLARYAEELAGTFHRFYTECRILAPDDPERGRTRPPGSRPSAAPATTSPSPPSRSSPTRSACCGWPHPNGSDMPGPWPLTAERDDAGVLHVGGVAVTDLARDHGTPLWVVDEADLRERCQRYVDGFPGVEVAYASKAWCTVGILQLVDDEGLLIDVASEGEMHTALVAGVDPAKLIHHGNNKSEAELDRALEIGLGRIVVDSFDELERLERLAAARDTVAQVWLRITPGIDAHTHEYVRTGHDDAKFGFTLSLGLADRAILAARDLEHVEVVGIHAHIGSQIFGTDPFIANADVCLDLLARWRDEHGITLSELNLGGGMGIRYTHEDHPGRGGALRQGRARGGRGRLRAARLPTAAPGRRARPRHRRSVHAHPLRGGHHQAAARA